MPGPLSGAPSSSAWPNRSSSSARPQPQAQTQTHAPGAAQRRPIKHSLAAYESYDLPPYGGSQPVPSAHSSLLGLARSHPLPHAADDLSDPRGWEVRTPPRHYGSAPDARAPAYLFDELDQDGRQAGLAGAAGTGAGAGLPLFDEKMETRQRRTLAGGQDAADGMMGIGEKRGMPQLGEVVEDDSGKWGKGHGAGPGVGGKRGLPPRQRITGWVSHSSH